MLSMPYANLIPLMFVNYDSASATTALEPETQTVVQKQRLSQVPFAVGVDLGGTNIRAAVVQGSEVIAKVSQHTPAKDGPAAVIAAIAESIHEVMELAELGMHEIRGIGVSAPGPLNPMTGIVYTAPNLVGWIDVPLRDELKKFFSVPVVIGHDATLAALGEWKFGAGRNTTDMVYMTVSTGIGGGVIAGSRIVNGGIGTAGEIGHMYLDPRPDAPVCGAGHHGCLEALASGTAIGLEAMHHMQAGDAQGIVAIYHELEVVEHGPDHDPLAPIELSARDVVESAHRGDQEALDIVHAASRYIGLGCVNLIHVLNPENIVIGGSVAKGADHLLFDTIREVIQAFAFARPASAIKILEAELGDDVGLIGAAAYIDYMHGESAPAYRGPTTL